MKKSRRRSRSKRIIRVNIRQGSKIERNSTKKSSRTNDSNSQLDMKKSNEWPDWTSFETEHRKKNKFTWRNVIFPIAFFLFILIITILLVILLRKPTTRLSKPVVLQWSTTGITVAGQTSQPGTAADRLNYPDGVRVDWSYSIYIADGYNHRIQRYIRETSIGETLCGQPSGISGSDQFHLKRAYKLLVDLNNNIYIADRDNNRIQFWKSNLTFGTTVAAGLYGPEGLDIDFNSNILYVGDTFSHRVMRYTLGNLTGTLVAGGNGLGNNSTQLYYPTGVDYDEQTNSLLISNHGTANIVRWKIGENQRTHVAGDINGIPGSTSSRLSGPECITVDPMGNIYVADKLNHRIQYFSINQTNGTTIAGKSSIFGNSSQHLYSPFDVTLDNQLNIYVADADNHRVQKFLRY